MTRRELRLIRNVGAFTEHVRVRILLGRAR